ncbi:MULTISPECIES: alpha/beta hydrolase [Sphingomonas]|uniref:alpha/beta hydrolase n=1 Tax=Sphingomonas TaxID=13687 RepID=UPI000DEF2328|nr:MULTISPECIES: alpha/beta fold hydrolase [Sphingomonas]
MITLILAAAQVMTASPGALRQTELTAGTGRQLVGTLLQAVGTPRATVLIIPGSGPTDRNGNNPLGINAAPYKLLAEGLAARGIATLRIDKRGLGGSRGAGDGNNVTIGRYAADTGSWVTAARQATGARCVWLAGHSEGGLIALAAADRPDVCGLVLLEAAGRPLGGIIREQLRANPANAPILADAERALTSLEAGRRVEAASLPPALGQGLFNPAVQDFLIDELRYDPAKLLAAYKGPVLVVQGGTDLQVKPADADRLVAARPGVARADFPTMNHILKEAPAARDANIATYGNPNLPLAPGLVDRIAAFVTEKRR